MSKPVPITAEGYQPLDQNEAARLLALAETLRREIAALTDDEEVIRDTLEGATDIDGILDFLIAEVHFDEALVDGLKGAIATSEKRKQRVEQRIEAKRSLIHKALSIARWKNRVRPLGTLSLAPKQPVLEIVDESKIPVVFWKDQDPKLDKIELLAAIKKAKEEGKEIPGAKLADESFILKIRKS